MSITLTEAVEGIGKAIDFAGVLVILGSALFSTVVFGYRLYSDNGSEETYRAYRRTLGRGILVGLELLVAGDIVRTVAIVPTFESVGVLAAIILIRTFLSFTLELEITGRWPWQRAD